MFLDSYPLAAEKKDASYSSRALCLDCLRFYAPLDFIKSQRGAGDPDGLSLSNSEYESHLSKELLLFQSIRIDVLDTCIDVETLKTWAWCQHWTKISGSGEDLCQECV